MASCAGSSGTRSSAQYERNAIGSVLRAGFSEIRDKGLVERPTSALFIAGLRNIGKLDPELRFQASEDRVWLEVANLEVFGLARPNDDDLQGWVDVTALMFQASRKLSPLAASADRETLYQFMFDGALLQIDPYSRYSSTRNAGFNRANRNGFIGVGIEYEMRVGGAYISSVVEDGPAHAAGLLEGDLIAAVDGRDATTASRDNIRRMLSGPSDTTVKVSVLRDGVPEKLTFVVRRELIVPHTVQWAMTGDDVAVIQVHSFNVRTATEVSQAVAAIKDTTANKVKGYVLDLRGDPGGLLDQAVDLSDLFLDSGSIVTLSGRHPGSKQFYSARAGDIADGKPLVLLVDGKSASSSEIAAAALMDNGRAITVGTNTLGKGSVQTLIRLPNDGEIALTWAEVLSPAGYKVHGLGLLPSVCTSDYQGNLATVIESVKRRQAPWRELPEAWRSFERTAENIGKMRGLCPAQSRPEDENDQVLAVRLAADRALYAQASSTNLAASR